MSWRAELPARARRRRFAARCAITKAANTAAAAMARAICSRIASPIDYAIVGEPSGLYVVNGQAGYLFVKIVIWGKFAYLTTRGHRGSGISAIEEAAEVVRALSEWGTALHGASYLRYRHGRRRTGCDHRRDRQRLA